MFNKSLFSEAQRGEDSYHVSGLLHIGWAITCRHMKMMLFWPDEHNEESIFKERPC